MKHLRYILIALALLSATPVFAAAREFSTLNLATTSSISSYWKEDGNGNDETGLRNLTDSSITYGVGKFGTSSIYSGSARQYSSVMPTGTVGSLSVWTTSTESGQLGAIISRSKETNPYSRVAIPFNYIYAGSVSFGWSGGTLNTYPAAGNYADGGWHNVIITMTSSGVRMKIDGVLQSLSFLTGNSTTRFWWDDVGNDHFQLGSDSYDGNNLRQPFIGRLDDVVIFQQPLNDWEENCIAVATDTLCYEPPPVPEPATTVSGYFSYIKKIISFIKNLV